MPTTKYNYYHINYRSIVNIVKEIVHSYSLRMSHTVYSYEYSSKSTYFQNRPKMNGLKYKLHKMQEKIESEERDNSNRASFMCPNCQKTFTDLEVSFNFIKKHGRHAINLSLIWLRNLENIWETTLIRNSNANPRKALEWGICMSFGMEILNESFTSFWLFGSWSPGFSWNGVYLPDRHPARIPRTDSMRRRRTTGRPIHLKLPNPRPRNFNNVCRWINYWIQWVENLFVHFATQKSKKILRTDRKLIQEQC